MEGTSEQQEHLAYIAGRAQAVAAARDDLNAALTAARRDGVPLRKIADAAGLSHERVRTITTEGGSR